MNTASIRKLLLIACLVTVWGVNWPLTKIALNNTPPILFAGFRTLLGGLLLLFMAIPRGKSLRLRQNWAVYGMSSLFNIILYYGLQTVGLQYMPSGLFSVIVFLQPVLVGILSWFFLGEAMYGLKITGLILGFGGVALISVTSLSGHISALGLCLALETALTWAIGTVYVKKTGPSVDSIWLVCAQLILGGLFLSGTGLMIEPLSAIHWSMEFVLILLFIAIFVIAIGWWIFFSLIGEGEVSRVASVTFLIPLISIAVGSVALHEQLTIALLAGLTLIVVSLILVNRPRKPMP